jgi:hypothetical protein
MITGLNFFGPKKWLASLSSRLVTGESVEVGRMLSTSISTSSDFTPAVFSTDLNVISRNSSEKHSLNKYLLVLKQLDYLQNHH